jgi:hypothetical protein
MKSILKLILSIITFTVLSYPALSQISTFPSTEGFEGTFTIGTNVEFIPNWTANETQASARVFKSSISRTGTGAMGVIPTASFNGVVTIKLDLTAKQNGVVSFYAASSANPTGDRPAVLRMRTSSDNGVSWSAYTNIVDLPNSNTSYSQYTYTLPADADNKANVLVQMEVSRGAGSGNTARALFDDFEFNASSLSSPAITANPIALTGFSYLENNGPSTEQTYTLSASNLVGTGDIVLTTSSDFEISLSNTTFTDVINLPFAAGEITNQPFTVYVRLKSGLSTNNYIGTISHIGGSASATVNLSGDVIFPVNPPLFNLSNADFSFDSWASNSAIGSYPNNMRFTFTTDPTGGTYNPLADGTALYDCAYNASSRSRINGNNNNGISFLATGGASFNDCISGTAANTRFVGTAVIGLNTLGLNYAKVRWLNRLISQTDIGREFAIRLQYRLTSTGDFIDFNDTPQYLSAGKLTGSTELVEYDLPSNVLNQPELYLRLVYFQIANNGGGSRPEIGIDDILITKTKSFYSKANGDLSLPSTWNSETDGSGTDAVDFSSDNQEFVFNRNVGVLDNALTIAGLNSKLIIENGSELQLEPAGRLTLDVELENNGTLTLKSGATILTNNAMSGSGIYNVEQFLNGSGGANPTGRFYYMGTPVTGATTSVFNPEVDNRFWTHTEVTGLYTRIMDNTTSLEAGGGYTIRMGADETVVYSSNTLNNGNYTFAGLSNTQARPKAERGIHLWSNPYPSHIDWELINRTNIDLTYQLRTQNTTTNAMVFDTYNAISGVGTNNNGNGALNKYIAPFQAIWVRVNANIDEGILALNNSMRSHQNGNVLKSNSDQEIIRLHLSNGSVYDETVIYMHANANNDLDAFDSQKMMDEHHQLFSIEAGSKLVLNGIENASVKESVQLGIKIDYSGTYSINANELNTMENVVLEDKKENKLQDLKANPRYVFTTTQGEDLNRFVLHFNKTVDQTTSNQLAQNTNDEVRIFAFNGNQVKVIIDDKSYENANINVYNMLGALVSSQKAESRENILSLDVATGIYMVEIVSKEKVTTQKVMIK